jgi:hypothetical protein
MRRPIPNVLLAGRPVHITVRAQHLPCLNENPAETKFLARILERR